MRRNCKGDQKETARKVREKLGVVFWKSSKENRSKRKQESTASDTDGDRAW